MTRTIYGFDDLGRKVPTGSYNDPTVKTVGGRIFFINDDSDEVVRFYDAQGNVITDIYLDKGPFPVYYEVINAGTSGKEKYFVYDTEYTPTYTGKFYWTYKKDGNWVYEKVDTRDSLGAGKENTLKIMAVRDGEYITDHADPDSQNPTETLWWYINYMNTQEIGGCDDWYIGTYQENLRLRDFMVSNSITGYGFSGGVFTSAEYGEDISYAYAVKEATGTYMFEKNSGTYKGCAIRSF